MRLLSDTQSPLKSEEVLFHDCCFDIYLGLVNPSDLCQALADRITKLEVDLVSRPEATYNNQIFQRFIGGEIGRIICSFRISENMDPDWRSTSLLKALLKKFVRYETVIIRLWVPEWITKQLPGKTLCQSRRKADWPPMVPQDVTPITKLLQVSEENRNKMRTDLESTLGPGEMFDEGSWRCVEFHPIVHSIDNTVEDEGN